MKKLVFLSILLIFTVIFSAEQTFPKFTLDDFDGNSVSIDSIMGMGKPIMLTFWATWCKPCCKELNKYVEYWEKQKSGHQYVVVALCEDGPRSKRKAKSLAEKQKWTNFILLYDKAGQVKKKAGVVDIPELFILYPDGTIYYRHIGFNTGDEKETFKKLEVLIEELEKEKAPQIKPSSQSK